MVNITPVAGCIMYFPDADRTVEIHKIEADNVIYSTWLRKGTPEEYAAVKQLPLEYFNLHVSNIWGKNANIQH